MIKTSHFVSLRVGGMLAAAMALGCGLDEYEQKMLKHQAQFDLLGEIDQKLGPPLELPPALAVELEGDKTKGPPLDFFYRPPREINSSPAEPDNPFGGVLHRYGRTTRGTQGTLTDIYLAVEPTRRGRTYATFRQDILGIFGAMNISPERNVEFERAGKKLQFLYQSFEDRQANFAVYFLHNLDVHAALAFRVDKGSLTPHLPLIETSLKTLHAGLDAGRVRADYQRKHKPKREEPAQ
jgi:hypothetical protein